MNVEFLSADMLSFKEPKLPDFKELVAQNAQRLALKQISTEDLPLVLVEEPNFASICASVKMVNAFLESYDVGPDDRRNLIQGILTMVNETARNIIKVKDEEHRSKETVTGLGGQEQEYFGQYL